MMVAVNLDNGPEFDLWILLPFLFLALGIAWSVHRRHERERRAAREERRYDMKQLIRDTPNVFSIGPIVLDDVSVSTTEWPGPETEQQTRIYDQDER
jgi:hypothetical protein